MTVAPHLRPIETLALYPPHGETVWGLMVSRASTGPARPFLVFQGVTRTYGETLDLADCTARMLLARGVGKGDRVAVMAPNSDAYVLLFLGLARIGAIFVPVNPELGIAETTYILKHAGVSAVACMAEALTTARAACAEMARGPWFMLLDGAAFDVSSFWDLIRSAPVAELPTNVTADDTCAILYTSGTSGFPKGAMHSQRNFVVAAEAFVERMHLQPHDRLFVVLPLFHVNGLFYSLGGALAAGASLLISPKFSASSFWWTVADGGATVVNIIAAIGTILARRPRHEFVPGHSLRKMSAAPITREIADAFRGEFGVPHLVEGYSLTEVPGVCCTPFGAPLKLGSIGLPARHADHARTFAELHVTDDDGNDLSDGQPGELLVRSPVLMQGYNRDPEQTAQAFRDGWFRTGDVVYRDTDGYYFFVGRKKDVIRKRGENISGAEIDRVVASHPKVLEAAAIAVPSELGEDEVLVAVVPKPGVNLQPADVAEWCARHLAPIKRPRYLVVVDELPHTPTHRVAKFNLKQDPTLLGRAVDLQDPQGRHHG